MLLQSYRPLHLKTACLSHALCCAACAAACRIVSRPQFPAISNKNTVWISGSWVKCSQCAACRCRGARTTSSSIPLYKLLEAETKTGQEYCAVRWNRSTSAENEVKLTQGFVACRFLGKAPLSIRNGRSTHIKTRLENILQTLPNPQYSATRAF